MSAHSDRCRLAPGHEWRECLCAQIDPADVPCVICDSIELSAEECDGCRSMLAARQGALPIVRALLGIFASRDPETHTTSDAVNGE